MKHAVKTIHFVGAMAVQRTALVMTAAHSAADADEGARS